MAGAVMAMFPLYTLEGLRWLAFPMYVLMFVVLGDGCGPSTFDAGVVRVVLGERPRREEPGFNRAIQPTIETWKKSSCKSRLTTIRDGLLRPGTLPTEAAVSPRKLKRCAIWNARFPKR